MLVEGLDYFSVCQVFHSMRVYLVQFDAFQIPQHSTSTSHHQYALEMMKFALKTAAFLPYFKCCDSTPLREGESSMMSSWARLLMCIISISAPHNCTLSLCYPNPNPSANICTMRGRIFLPYFWK